MRHHVVSGMRLGAIGLALGSALLLAAEPAHETLDSLVATERAFAAHSIEHGMKDAFLTYLADDGVVFRPLPVNGKKVWSAREPSAATLAWEPAFAEVSGSGDLGYTTGPWEFRPSADSTGTVAPERIAHGHFVTVWRRPSGGEWRFVADLGVTHAKPESAGVGSGAFTAGPDHEPASAPDRRRRATDLRQTEERYVREVGRDPEALARWITTDVRAYREGRAPVLGRAEARELYQGLPPLRRVRTLGAGAAAAADLGYAYGVLERGVKGAAPDSSVFLDLWRREPDGSWRIALRVENPVERPR